MENKLILTKEKFISQISKYASIGQEFKKLHNAIKKHNFEDFLNLIKENKKALTYKNKNNYTLLDLAIEYDNLEVLKYYIKTEPQYVLENSHILNLAVTNKSINSFKEILNFFSLNNSTEKIISHIDSASNNTFFNIIKTNNIYFFKEIIPFLQEKNLEDIFYNYKNENSDNALHILATSNADNFNFLIHKLKNLNNEFNNQQLTPLMISISNTENELIIDEFINNGDINLENCFGHNSLLSAIYGNQINNIEKLIKLGVNIKASGLHNKNGLMASILNGQEDVSLKLLELGINPFEKNLLNYHSFWYACNDLQNNSQVFNYILNNHIKEYSPELEVFWENPNPEDKQIKDLISLICFNGNKQNLELAINKKFQYFPVKYIRDPFTLSIDSKIDVIEKLELLSKNGYNYLSAPSSQELKTIEEPLKEDFKNFNFSLATTNDKRDWRSNILYNSNKKSDLFIDQLNWFLLLRIVKGLNNQQFETIAPNIFQKLKFSDTDLYISLIEASLHNSQIKFNTILQEIKSRNIDFEELQKTIHQKTNIEFWHVFKNANFMKINPKFYQANEEILDKIFYNEETFSKISEFSLLNNKEKTLKFYLNKYINSSFYNQKFFSDLIDRNIVYITENHFNTNTIRKYTNTLDILLDFWEKHKTDKPLNIINFQGCSENDFELFNIFKKHNITFNKTIYLNNLLSYNEYSLKDKNIWRQNIQKTLEEVNFKDISNINIIKNIFSVFDSVTTKNLLGKLEYDFTNKNDAKNIAAQCLEHKIIINNSEDSYESYKAFFDFFPELTPKDFDYITIFKNFTLNKTTKNKTQILNLFFNKIVPKLDENEKVEFFKEAIKHHQFDFLTFNLDNNRKFIQEAISNSGLNYINEKAVSSESFEQNFESINKYLNIIKDNDFDFNINNIINNTLKESDNSNYLTLTLLNNLSQENKNYLEELDQETIKNIYQNSFKYYINYNENPFYLCFFEDLFYKTIKNLPNNTKQEFLKHINSEDNMKFKSKFYPLLEDELFSSINSVDKKKKMKI